MSAPILKLLCLPTRSVSPQSNGEGWGMSVHVQVAKLLLFCGRIRPPAASAWRCLAVLAKAGHACGGELGQRAAPLGGRCQHDVPKFSKLHLEGWLLLLDDDDYCKGTSSCEVGPMLWQRH
jgi:hypothetical protein